MTEFRDVFGIALTNMIGGADVATELRKATDSLQTRPGAVAEDLTQARRSCSATDGMRAP